MQPCITGPGGRLLRDQHPGLDRLAEIRLLHLLLLLAAHQGWTSLKALASTVCIADSAGSIISSLTESDPSGPANLSHPVI